MKEVKYCPYCRAEIVAGQMSCTTCGKQIPEVVADFTAEKTNVEGSANPVCRHVSNKTEQSEQINMVSPVAIPLTKQNGNMLVAVLAGATVVLCITLVVAVVSGGGDSNKECTTQVVGSTQSSDGEESNESVAEYDEFQPDDDDWEETLYDFACERELTASDLAYMSKDELRIMRNWIFARHGYIFKSQDLKDYFGQMPWYEPRYSDVTSQLSSIEKKNIEFIKRYE